MINLSNEITSLHNLYQEGLLTPDEHSARLDDLHETYLTVVHSIVDGFQTIEDYPNYDQGELTQWVDEISSKLSYYDWSHRDLYINPDDVPF